MPRTTRNALLVAGFTALLATGCATAVPGVAAPQPGLGAATTSAAPPSEEPAGSTDDAVAWVDDVCGALLPFVETASTQPDINPSDPVAAVEGLSDYLGQAVDGLDSAIDGMAAAGPSPVDGGDEVVERLTEALTSFRTSFADAKTAVDAVDTSDTLGLVEALPKAVEPLEAIANVEDPTADLRNNPELNAAAEQAPNCQQLPS